MKVQGVDASAPPQELKRGPEAAEAFEAYLIGFLSKQMRESVPDGPLNSGATGMFGDIFDQEMGKRVAEGQGIGLRHQLEMALARHDDGAPERRPVASGNPIGESHLRVTSGFGERADPFHGAARIHHGVDLGLSAGSAVRAERAGVVSFAGERGGYGNVVIIDHGGGLETRYAHCASLAVAAGDTVPRGAVVGTVGSTGRSTGPHLHLEVRQDGVALDPSSFVEENR